MPGKHRDGYNGDYYRARKQATDRLVATHRDEYDEYLAEAWRALYDPAASP